MSRAYVRVGWLDSTTHLPTRDLAPREVPNAQVRARSIVTKVGRTSVALDPGDSVFVTSAGIGEPVMCRTRPVACPFGRARPVEPGRWCRSVDGGGPRSAEPAPHGAR
jgi:hypothetical protein